MTVRVTPKMRKRIDAMKNKKELVTDQSYKDINKRGFIYESPDGGKTIYRGAQRRDWNQLDLFDKEPYIDGNPDYDEVSGVKLDKKSTKRISFVEIFVKLNNIEREVRNLKNRLVEMERNTEF